MNIKKVEVSFLFEGIINQSENMQGVLFGDKVFLNDNQCGPCLYTAVITDNDDKILVNLDADSTDYLAGNADLLLDLIVG